MIEAMDECGTGTHCSTKAAAAALSWYVAMGSCGKMPTGLLDKRLSKADWETFDTESHVAGDWLSQFQVSRLAKLGA